MEMWPAKEELDRWRQRDPIALRSLVETHTPALLGAARGMGFSPTDAEELTQSVFVTFLEAVNRFEGRSSLPTYLYGILRFKALEWRRHNLREQGSDKIEELLDARFDARGLWTQVPQGPEENALNKELKAMMEDCLTSLTTAQRLAFYLKEVEGRSTQELCKILDVTVTHVGVLLFRARNKLLLCLEEKMGKKP